jgi:hypothetical protein
MSDGPRVSMSGIADDRWDRIFGPARRVGVPSDAPARIHPVRAEFAPDPKRAGMDRMAGRMVAEGAPAGHAEQIARDAAYRADARENGGTVRPYAHRPDDHRRKE